MARVAGLILPVTTNVGTGSKIFQLSPAAADKLGLSQHVARAHARNSMGFNGDSKIARHDAQRHGGRNPGERTDVVFVGMGMDKELWNLQIGSAFLKDLQ